MSTTVAATAASIEMVGAARNAVALSGPEALPSLVRACTCALAYDFQLIAEVPELPFDARVDRVVTDGRVIRIEG